MVDRRSRSCLPLLVFGRVIGRLQIIHPSSYSNNISLARLIAIVSAKQSEASRTCIACNIILRQSKIPIWDTSTIGSRELSIALDR